MTAAGPLFERLAVLGGYQLPAELSCAAREAAERVQAQRQSQAQIRQWLHHAGEVRGGHAAFRQRRVPAEVRRAIAVPGLDHEALAGAQLQLFAGADDAIAQVIERTPMRA